ncbi:secretion protein EspS, partial [Escherichia coli]
MSRKNLWRPLRRLYISASVSVPTKQSQSIPITLAGRTIEKAQEKE